MAFKPQDAMPGAGHAAESWHELARRFAPSRDHCNSGYKKQAWHARPSELARLVTFQARVTTNLRKSNAESSTVQNTANLTCKSVCIAKDVSCT